MNYGSICSGVEAASLAWRSLGWKAKFFAEVEPFPSAVLQQRFGATKPLRPLSPETADGEKDRKERETWAKQIAELPDGGSVPNLGDFTQITTKDYDGAIDLIVGGTPCQSYSLAGLRKGLADPRGNLALEFVKLAYRTGVRWTLWENGSYGNVSIRYIMESCDYVKFCVFYVEKRRRTLHNFLNT